MWAIMCCMCVERGRYSGPLFEYSRIHIHIKKVSLHIFVPENTMWIHFPNQVHEFIEPRIQHAKIFRPKRMVFCPVRSTVVFHYDIDETLKVSAVRYRKIVGPSTYYSNMRIIREGIERKKDGALLTCIGLDLSR